MPQIVTRPTAPLDPDPFVLEGSKPLSLDPSVHLYFDPDGYPFPLRLRKRRGALYRPIESSLAVIAHIPPGALHFPYSTFQDDRVTLQDNWLSQAYLSNRFRLVHGLRVRGFADPSYGFDSALPDGRLLGRANPTTLRGFPLARFRAPIQYSTYPAPGRIPLPPGPPDQEVLAIASDMRAMNGFFVKPLGKVAWRLQQVLEHAFRSEAREAIPQIGVSLQLWLAQDGCKCFAFAHNHFPRYTAYLDGTQLNWSEPLNFTAFTDYNVNVEWRPFLAFLLYDALSPFPLRERYPGACGVGWYRSVSTSGQIEWCDTRPPAEILSFTPRTPDSEESTRAWWERLERYVKLFIAMRGQHRDDREPNAWWADSRELNGIWASLGIQSRHVSVRRKA